MLRNSLPFSKAGLYKLMAGSLLSCLLTVNTEAQTNHINENFSSASGTTPPTGWSNSQISAPSPASIYVWNFSNPGSRSVASPISDPFAIFDSDNIGTWPGPGSNGPEEIALQSPAVNTTGFTVVKLKWDQQFRCGYGGAIYVDVFNGTSWNNVYSNTSTTGYVTNSPDIDVSTYAANKTGVRVRFRWVGEFSWWWIVDNVQLYTPPMCTGTPSPGNTLSTVAPFICPSSPGFTLSLSGTLSGLGLTYEWQSSATGTGGWNAISGATSATYAGSLSSGSLFYRCKVTCTPTTNFAFSNPIQLTSSIFGCYCVPGLTNCWQYDDVILNVTISNLNNNSTCPGTGSSYTSYVTTLAPAMLPRGSTNGISVFVGPGGDEEVTVWIDSNQNGVLNTNEYWYLGSGNGSAVTGNIAISSSAKLGNTLMRVRMEWDEPYASNEPCVTGTYGETEDYLVTICPQTPTAIAGQRCGPGNAVCAVSSNTGVTSPVFRWYTVPSGGTAIAGQTGASLSAYAITGTTTFYVSEIQDGVESIRVPVIATVNPNVTASTTAKTDVTCYNGNDGTATVGVTTGTANYSYSWNTSPLQTGSTATGLTPGNYICTVTDSKTCTDTATVTINNAPASTIPAITTQPTDKTICAGTNTSFTAAGTGLNIAYQWYLSTGGPLFNPITAGGGVYSGFASPTLNITAATPAMNGYRYRCLVSGTCTPAASTNIVTLTVNATIPSVSVNPSATTICAGTSVTFTASPTNGGTAPSYQWRVNGSPVGSNSATYTTSGLTNGQMVRCDMTSNATCPYPATVQSSNITMTVNPIVNPTISIASGAGNSVCDGASVTFTASITGGGPSPIYQWKVNNNNVGTNSATYNTSSLSDGDVVTCQLTSSVPCPVPTVVTSMPLTMTVIPNVTPAVTIASDKQDICPGTMVTFTATPVNGGTTPSYQWVVNGSPVTTAGSATFSTANLNNGDVVSCAMTSSVTCVTSALGTSNNITMNVLPILTPSLIITATPDSNICSGTNVMFDAHPTNGGTAPVYQWYLNGAPMVGAVAGIYSVSVLNTGDVVTADMTSNAKCAVPQGASSNSITFTVNSVTIPAAQISSDKGNDIIEGDEVTFTATALNVGSAPWYKWRKNEVEIQGANGATYTTTELVNDDKIDVVAFSSEMCSNPDSVISNHIVMLVHPVGISSVEGTFKNLSLYPNPNKGMFTVSGELATTEKEVTLEVVNNLGQTILQQAVTVGGGKLRTNISVQDVASGTYLLRVISESETVTRTFVIQR